MNTVVSLLLMIVNSDMGASVDRAIALACLRLLGDPKALTLARVAQEAATTPRTVNKFCATLGYRSFSVFKPDLISTCNARRMQMEHHVAQSDLGLIEQSISLHASVPFDLARFREEVRLLNEAIRQSDNVVIVGAVFPQMLFMHYEEDMLMLGKLVYALPVARHMRASDEIGPDDLLVFVSFTGRLFSYYPDEYRALARRCRRVAYVGPAQARPSGLDDCLQLTMPFVGDSEGANTVLLEMLQYLKCRYVARGDA